MGTDSIRYHYSSQWGALDTIIDPFGHKFAWQYDADGRVSQLTRYAERPDTTVVEQATYDADSRLARRMIMRGATALLRDTLIYDRRGKVVRNPWVGDSIAYTPLGHLRYAAYANAMGSEAFTMDGAGNRVARLHAGTETYSYDPGTDLLRTRLRAASFSWDTVSYGYNSNTEQVSEIHITPYTFYNAGALDTAKEQRITAASYGSGLMKATTYTLDTIPGPGPHYQIYQRKESYRYDAFGRRVWVELVRDTNCTTHDTSSDCSNYVRRVTWDGNQILREKQVAADTGSWDAIKEGGSVTYLHGGTIDQPLEVYKSSTKLLLPYVNWRGQFVAGTCPLAYCVGITFPLADASAYDDLQNGDANGTWFGTLIKGQIDASGYEYKRNRYYNPSTGRFTQEDPIGLAGGLNVYGYANGDPASYSDPFGMCPCNGDLFAQQVGALLTPVQRPLEIAGTIATLPLLATGEGAVVTLGLGAKALSTTSTFFRGVSAAEAADVVSQGGKLRAGAAAAGNEGKYLTNTFSGAAKWAAQNGEGSQVLQITVPVEDAQSFQSLGRIDGIGNAWWAPMQALSRAVIKSVGEISAAAPK